MGTTLMTVRGNAGMQTASALYGKVKAATATLDARGVLQGWSDGAEEILGYAPHEVLGKPAAALLANPTVTDADLAGACRSGQTWSGPALLRHRNGHTVEVVLQVSPVAPTETGAWVVLAVDLAQLPWWGVQRLLLEGLLTCSFIGMAVLDTDLRCLWSNDALVRATGIPSEQRLGRGLEVVFPPETAELREQQIRQVLRTGTPLTDFEYHGPTLAHPEGGVAYSASFFRIEDSVGRAMGVGALVQDVTERRRTRERLILLNRAGKQIGTTADVMRTAQEITDVAVPGLADFASVDVFDGVICGKCLEEAERLGRRMLLRAGQQTVDGKRGTTLTRGDQVTLLSSSSPTALALDKGTSTLEPVVDAGNSAWANEAPGRAAWVRDTGMHSVAVVPLCTDDVVLGAATFGRSRTVRAFTEDDLLFIQEFAARAANSLDRGRRFTHERTTALALQRRLLPHHLSGGPCVEVAWRYLPAGGLDGVGGDWCDVIPLSGARVALVVGDVMGHGIDAAATMGRLRAAVHTLADLDLPPDELLARLDDAVIRLAEEPDETSSGSPELATLGATCLYAVYDPVTQMCAMARAGHPPPAVVRPDGTVDFAELPAGPPLGLGSMPFEAVSVPLLPGSLLALFTDGLIDTAGHDIDDQLARLSTALTDRAPTLDDLCGQVVETLLDGPPRDDAALLLARTHPLDPRQVAMYTLAPDPSVVADVRAWAAQRLRLWGLEELQFSTELIVSELVTNAIRYGAAPIGLRLIHQDKLICEVSDGISNSPRLRHARIMDEGGRGLFLVAQLTERWGVRYTDPGKIIWAEQGVGPPAET
ncbi:SpoIIE family protein phosphatase [Streptomyces mirabilis]|uniref:SpoIIE family protein phosphatase n=1 Tax=Streptomyces mirabilis TaxID=68239 RepID=UPI0033A61EAF